MTAATLLPTEVDRTVLARLRNGETHLKVAADLGLSRHTVDRIAREHGVTRRRKPDPVPRIPNRRDDEWVLDAACGGDFGFDSKPVAEQQKVCAGCTVLVKCWESGLEGPTPMVHWKKGEGPVHGGWEARDLRRLKQGKKAS